MLPVSDTYSLQLDRRLNRSPLCAGIDRIGLDGTLYDQVLDFIFYLGLAPKRFQVCLWSLVFLSIYNACLCYSSSPTAIQICKVPWINIKECAVHAADVHEKEIEAINVLTGDVIVGPEGL